MLWIHLGRWSVCVQVGRHGMAFAQRYPHDGGGIGFKYGQIELLRSYPHAQRFGISRRA